MQGKQAALRDLSSVIFAVIGLVWQLPGELLMTVLHQSQDWHAIDRTIQFFSFHPMICIASNSSLPRQKLIYVLVRAARKSRTRVTQPNLVGRHLSQLQQKTASLYQPSMTSPCPVHQQVALQVFRVGQGPDFEVKPEIRLCQRVRQL